MENSFSGVGERIAHKINELGLKQVDVCKAINISKNAMSNYINGKRIPDTFTTYKIAQFLMVSMEWLLTGLDPQFNTTNENPKNHISSTESEILTLLNQLSEREQMKVVGYIEALVDKSNDNKKGRSSASTHGEESATTETEIA